MNKVISKCFIVWEGFHFENKLRGKIGKRESRKIGKDLHLNRDKKVLKVYARKENQ